MVHILPSNYLHDLGPAKDSCNTAIVKELRSGFRDARKQFAFGFGGTFLCSSDECPEGRTSADSDHRYNGSQDSQRRKGEDNIIESADGLGEKLFRESFAEQGD